MKWTTAPYSTRQVRKQSTGFSNFAEQKPGYDAPDSCLATASAVLNIKHPDIHTIVVDLVACSTWYRYQVQSVCTRRVNARGHGRTSLIFLSTSFQRSAETRNSSGDSCTRTVPGTPCSLRVPCCTGIVRVGFCLHISIVYDAVFLFLEAQSTSESVRVRVRVRSRCRPPNFSKALQKRNDPSERIEYYGRC
jgi:hypothetical protein